MVRFLHEKGAAFTIHDRSAIHSAAVGERTDIIDYLLQHGQNIDFPDSQGSTAFLNAISRGQERLWTYFADRGANIHALDRNHRNACSYAAQGNRLAALRWLLEHQIDVNQPDHLDMTPLHYAARDEALEALKLLVENHVDIKARSEDGSNACHYAAANGHREALQYLVDQGADGTQYDTESGTLYHDAINSGNLECIKFLADRFPSCKTQPQRNGCPPLTLAASGGYTEVVTWLMQNGMDINEQFDCSDSRFVRSWFALIEAVMFNKLDMVKFLLENGADPNLQTEHGSSALLTAAEHKSFAIVELLVEKGAKYDDVVDSDGDNCLSYAILNPDTDVLKWFATRNTAYDYANKYGLSPMLKAGLSPNVIVAKILHDAGFISSTPSLPDEDQAQGDFHDTSVWYARRALKSSNERINIHGRYSPLMIAAHNGHLDVVRYLYDEISEIRTCEDKDGNDALTCACCAGHLDVVKYLCRKEVDPNRTNKLSKTVAEETRRCLGCLELAGSSAEAEASKEPEEQKEETNRLQSEINKILRLLESGQIFDDSSEYESESDIITISESDSNDEHEDPVGNSPTPSSAVLTVNRREPFSALAGTDDVEQSYQTTECARRQHPGDNGHSPTAAEIRSQDVDPQSKKQEIDELKRRIEAMRTGRRINTLP